MAIHRMEIHDFLVFKGDFATTFCPGVNVLIGENGTGKTTLMKTIYMACDMAQCRHAVNKSDFQSTLDELKNAGKQFRVYQVVTLEPYFQYIPTVKGIISGFTDEENAIIDKNNPIDLSFQYGSGNPTEITVCGIDDFKNFVFIPTDDVLSHSKGFLALYKELELPFDKIYLDILSKAELSITREISPNAEKILDKIKGIIGGEVVYENDIFYLVSDKSKGDKIPFSLEASGFRKFGLLWKLLRNGLLEDGSVLFWDEPENSLNKELLPKLVDILLILAHNGVQIFIATHDYHLARYFDIRKNKDIPVMFHGLSKAEIGSIHCFSSPLIPNYRTIPWKEQAKNFMTP